MHKKPFIYQPGPILAAAIMAGLKARGQNLNRWCLQQGVYAQTVRQAMYGVMNGQRSQELVEQLVREAGEDYVRTVYEEQILQHAEEVRKGAA